jgi:hypothetical protein
VAIAWLVGEVTAAESFDMDQRDALLAELPLQDCHQDQFPKNEVSAGTRMTTRSFVALLDVV